jgi:hypothetical protein
MSQASERTLDLRGLLQQFRALTRDINQDTPLEEVVGIGREVWRFINDCHKAMEACKSRVRAEAGPTPGTHQFRGLDNTSSTVVVPEPIPVLRRGVGEGELADLRIALGGPLFDELFQTHERVKPRKSFISDMAMLDVLKRNAALDVVDTHTGKPRVSFDKRKV